MSKFSAKTTYEPGADRWVVCNESVIAQVRRMDVEDDDDLDGWYLCGISRVRDGQTGRASEVLKAICDMADEQGQEISLAPIASSGLTQNQLVEWYQRHGFRWIFPGIMTREPAIDAPMGDPDEFDGE